MSYYVIQITDYWDPSGTKWFSGWRSGHPEFSDDHGQALRFHSFSQARDVRDCDDRLRTADIIPD